jgi:peptidoglycan/LPS O-acetylase OafA/YrhL
MVLKIFQSLNGKINKWANRRDSSNILRNSIAIRTLLASIVCVSHQLYVFSDLHYMVLDTRLAVAAFFFISGFSIAHSLNGRTFDLEGLKKFFKARFKRVYVPYIVLILIQTFIFAYLFDAVLIHALRYFINNIVLLNYRYAFPGEVFQYPVNGSLWSLKWEVLCYILSPLLFKLSLNVKWSKLVFIGLLIAIAVSSFFDYVHTNKPLFLVFIFFVGLRLFFFSSLVLNWINRNRLVVVLALIGYTGLFLNGYLGGIYLGIIVVYYCLNNFELDKWIKTDISYSIYIVHFPMAVVARKIMGPDPVYNPLYIGILMVSTFLFAYIFALLVEKKLTAYLFRSSQI